MMPNTLAIHMAVYGTLLCIIARPLPCVCGLLPCPGWLQPGWDTCGCLPVLLLLQCTTRTELQVLPQGHCC